MISSFRRLFACVLAASLAATITGRAESVDWVSGAGDWFDSTKWTNGAGANKVPAAGDDVTIKAGATVLLTNETDALASFRMTGGTLVASNWLTRIRAQDVTLAGGTITLPVAFQWYQPTNRVWIVCTNFTLGSNASVNVDWRGYATTNGPGSSNNGEAYSPGASHGGLGGHGSSGAAAALANPTYGDLKQPMLPGSGGCGPTYGGPGGGVVFIDSQGGTATIFGAVSAVGSNYTTYHGSGGAGGSILIKCSVLAGSTNGLLRANGGSGTGNGGGGGGGRISVLYDPEAQALQPRPGVRMQTWGANGWRAGEDGTIYLPDTFFLTDTIKDQLFRNCFLYMGDATNWETASLLVSNATFVLANTGIVVTVTNDILVSAGSLGLGNQSRLYCGGNLQITNTASVVVYAGSTNVIDPTFGAWVGVTGLVTIATNCWVYPYTEPTNGGSAKFDLGGLSIQAGGGFNADAKGYARLTGPGAGGWNSSYGAGGGYGGLGGVGNFSSTRAAPYGDVSGPPLAGSGGGHTILGGSGGGLVWIDSPTGTVTLLGTLSANGESALSTHGGGGSGGGIFVRCARLDGGNSALVRAIGGNGNNGGGPGGGGRLAMLYDPIEQADSNPRIRFTTSRGLNAATDAYGLNRMSDHGTLYLPDTAFLTTNFTDFVFNNVYLYVSNFTSWAVDSVTFSSGSFTFANTGLVITVTNDYSVLIGATSGIPAYGVLTCRNLTVTNGAGLLVYGGVTNAAAPDYGALVQVSENMVVGPSSWVMPQSDLTNGGSPLFQVRDLFVADLGGFDANARGFLDGYGYGKGTPTWGGGGHGGRGGQPGGGIVYDLLDAPRDAGSGPAPYGVDSASGGGGAIRVRASGTLTLNGTMKAAGENGRSTHGAGAAGGTVFIDAKIFNASATGQLIANGGNANGNGTAAGGGRIAIWRFTDISSADVGTNVTGGTDATPTAFGSNGTVFVVSTAPAITNWDAENIANTTADMVGELTATGYSATAVWCLWGETDAGSVRDAWANTNYFGTNAPGVFTNSVSGLTAGTVYQYRWYATNDHGEAWAAPTKSFSTTGGGVTVNNGDGATDITPVSATLRGVVTAGNPAPAAYVCWGDADGGGASTANWQYVEYAGEALGAFSVGVTNLLANKTYYYRCYAVNSNADDWANSTTNFSTLGPYISIGDASVFEGDAGQVNLDFAVTLSATSIVDVTFDFASSNGTADAGTDYDATNATVTITAGNMSATITVLVNGDTEDEYPSQVMYVNLSNPANGQIADGMGAGTILDEDAAATTKVWSGTGSWTNDALWTPAGEPRPIDDAVIASGLCRLDTVKTAALVTVQSGATLFFTNWTTRLTASNVVVDGGGTITHAGPYDAPTVFVPNVMSNRIHIVCTDLTVHTNGQILADARGYTAAYGPGTGVAYAGASYGGVGGRCQDAKTIGSAYGIPSAPLAPGSGGGTLGNAGYGGGAVRIEAAGTVRVLGLISANGAASSSYNGGGSGGAVYIDCDVLAGSTNGLVRANGGTGNGSGGGGGGGRIAIVYDTVSQSGQPDPGVRMQAAGATGYKPGQDGTVYLPNQEFLEPVLQNQLFRNVRLFIPGFTNWSLPYLTLNNCSLAFGESNFVLQVTGDTTLNQGGLGLYGNFLFECGGDVILTNSSSLSLYCGSTNGVAPAHGGLVAATGALRVASGCWIYPYSDPVNGGSAKLDVGSLSVLPGGGINADQKGFVLEKGPGAGSPGTYGGGAGYGGRGGVPSGNYVMGPTYGSLQQPTEPGSGGGEWERGGSGGGLIWIHAPTGTVYVAGTLTANGEGGMGSHAGAGSGGGIYVLCSRFEGTTNGLLSARGAANFGGGAPGGGGRISVEYDTGAQAGYSPGVRFSAARYPSAGLLAVPERESEDGTLYLPDSSFLSTTLANGLFRDVYLTIPGFTNWGPTSLTLDGCRVTLAATNLVIAVTNDLTLQSGGAIGLMGDSRLSCRDISLSGGSYLVARSGPTNDTAGAHGVVFEARRDVTLTTGTWVHTFCDVTNGGAPVFRAVNISIATNAGFNADGRGYRYMFGPGKGGVSYGGAGHGGKGGNGSSGTGGPTYGSLNAPVMAGSGGDVNYGGGNGGGVVRIEASGTATIYGTLRANGADRTDLHGGGGSGGSILLSCGTLLTSTDTRFLATGGLGTGNGGAGGGGRIAVWYDGVNSEDQAKLLAGNAGSVRRLVVTNQYDGFLGVTSVTNGLGYYNPPDVRAAAPGTVVWLKVAYPPKATLFFVR